MSAGPEQDPASSPTSLPPLIRLGAAALAVPPDSITRAGGATGHTWACLHGFLRVGSPERLHREVLAMSAARSSLPVPEVLEASEFDDSLGRTWGVLLLARLPGRPAGDTSNLSTNQAMQIGEACGRLHALLATVTPPPGLPSVVSAGASRLVVPSSEPELLHLDLHPNNVLIDDTGEVSGVVDWANSAIGPQVLDKARSWSVMTLDPAAAIVRQEPAVQALLAGWSSAAGWTELSADARAWACEYMLVDLAARYPTAQLEGVQGALAAATS